MSGDEFVIVTAPVDELKLIPVLAVREAVSYTHLTLPTNREV